MINFLDKNSKTGEHKTSLTITYPRTVNIIFGYFPYPELLHSYIIDIKNNLKKSMYGYTNVKGGMTDWRYFVDNDNFNKFLSFLINKNQNSHPDIFQFFFEKNYVADAWGNEMKKGDSLTPHHHPCYHGILYLTKGCDLILPELNITITPKPGDYYLFPPNILHGFDKINDDQIRYSLIFNIKEKDQFKFNKKLENINDRKDG